MAAELVALKARSALDRAVLAKQPAAYYRLDDYAGGGVLRDLSGNGANGVWGGVSSAVALNYSPLERRGRRSMYTEASMNASETFAEISDGVSNSVGSSDFTAAILFRTSLSSGSSVKLFAKENVGFDYPEIMCDMLSGQLRFGYNTANNGAAAVVLTSPLTYNDDKTHLVALRRIGTVTSIVVDGVSVVTGSLSASIWDSTNPMCVGCVRAGSSRSNRFTGVLGHFMIFKTGLEDRHLRALYELAIRP